MPITTQASDDFSPGGGRYLKAEGWYHLIVTGATDTPTNRDGAPISGCAFAIDCTVAAGTSSGCEDQIVDFKFFEPTPTHKDGGEMSRKKISRALLAMNAITEGDKGKQVSVEAADLVGQQFVAHLTLREGSTGGQFIELAYADIFHVDDPEVKQHPKNQAALAAIAPEHRRVGSRPSQSAPAAASPAPATQPVAAPMGVDEIDL